MELLWDKSRILEVYLNIIEFGPGLYGIELPAKIISRSRLASCQPSKPLS